MASQKLIVRLTGIFFLLSFLSYGIGIGMIESANVPDVLLTDPIVTKNKLILGGILSAFLHTIFNLGLVAQFYTILKEYNKTVAYYYATLSLCSTFMLATGAIFLLLPLSFTELSLTNTSITPIHFNYFQQICSKANFYFYQLGMAIWGLGGLGLCYLLRLSGRVPGVLTAWGTLGYVVFMIGCFAELYGFSAGLLLSVPGGLFEISLSLWLIFRGLGSASDTTLARYSWLRYVS